MPSSALVPVEPVPLMFERLGASLGRRLPILAGVLPGGSGARPARLGDRLRFAAVLPAGPSTSACSVEVEVVRETHQDGERIRLRAHMQANLASVVRPAIEALRQRPLHPPPGRQALEGPRERSDPGGLEQRLSGLTAVRHTLRAATLDRAGRFAGAAAGRIVHSAWSNPWVQRVTEPLLRQDLNTWIEVQASTASLDRGASALLPPERFASLGIRPARTEEGVQIDVWSNGNDQCEAELSVLQLDKRDLPLELQRELGDRPFQLVATVARTAERK